MSNGTALPLLDFNLGSGMRSGCPEKESRHVRDVVRNFALGIGALRLASAGVAWSVGGPTMPAIPLKNKSTNCPWLSDSFFIHCQRQVGNREIAVRVPLPEFSRLLIHIFQAMGCFFLSSGIF